MLIALHQTGAKYNVHSDTGVFRLVIHKIGMEDAGTYTCHAGDKKTSAVLFVEGNSKHCRIYVLKLLIILTELIQLNIFPKRCVDNFTEMKILYKFTKRLPETARVRQKENIMLECMINDPRAHVKWFRNGEPLEVGLQVVFH